MPRNTRARTACYVTLPMGAGILNYGFNSGLLAADRATFGQTVINFDSVPSGTCFGANSPKPYRASKRLVTGYVSSWCSHDKVAALKAAKYSIGQPKRRNLTKTDLSDTYYVDIQGIKYAWQLPKIAGFDPTTAFTALGVTAATANDRNLVFGATLPKPARYKATLDEGTATERTISTFVDPDAEDNIPEGWVKAKNGRYLDLTPANPN